MKKLPFLFILAITAIIISCGSNDDSTWEDYTQWRESNIAWFNEQKARANEDGSKYYNVLIPDWDTSQCVLIHYFNDRKLTEGNLSPLYTSTVDVKYKGCLYNDEPFDSSYTNTASYGDSIYRTQCNNVIQGWVVALQDMRVGDSCEVVIPYSMAYGSQDLGTIKPYSMLKFGIKLVDIPFYEIKEN